MSSDCKHEFIGNQCISCGIIANSINNKTKESDNKKETKIMIDNNICVCNGKYKLIPGITYYKTECNMCYGNLFIECIKTTNNNIDIKKSCDNMDVFNLNSYFHEGAKNGFCKDCCVFVYCGCDKPKSIFKINKKYICSYCEGCYDVSLDTKIIIDNEYKYN